MLLNVEIPGSGFVGELQLTLRGLVDVKESAHRIYNVTRALRSGDEDELRRAAAGPPGLKSEEVLRLHCLPGKLGAVDPFGDLAVLEKALATAIPRGCGVAGIYDDAGSDSVRLVRLSVDNVSSLAELRDAVLSGAFDAALRDELPPQSLEIRADRAAFADSYAKLMMRFAKLTPHQKAKLAEIGEARVALLLAPAGEMTTAEDSWCWSLLLLLLLSMKGVFVVTVMTN